MVNLYVYVWVESPLPSSGISQFNIAMENEWPIYGWFTY